MVRDCSTYPVIIYERMRHLATSLLTVYRRQDVVILCLYRHVSLASADVCQADFTQACPVVYTTTVTTVPKLYTLHDLQKDYHNAVRFITHYKTLVTQFTCLPENFDKMTTTTIKSVYKNSTKSTTC